MVATALRTVKTREAFKAPGPQVNGLEAVREGLWLSDQQDNRTYLVDYNGKVHGVHNTVGGAPHAGPGVSGTLWVTRPGTLIIQHIDTETGELLSEIPFPAPRSHGMFWDEKDGTLSVVEANFGKVYKLNPRNGDVLDEWVIEGVEAHAMARSADGRVWIGDAATNIISYVEA